MAFGLAVYASQCRLLGHHARLASGCWLGFAAWILTTGFLWEVSGHDAMSHPPSPGFAWRNFFLNLIKLFIFIVRRHHAAAICTSNIAV